MDDLPPPQVEKGQQKSDEGDLGQMIIDGEMKRLIPMFLETGIGVVEAFAPQPMISVATRGLGDKAPLCVTPCVFHRVKRVASGARRKAR